MNKLNLPNNVCIIIFSKKPVHRPSEIVFKSDYNFFKNVIKIQACIKKDVFNDKIIVYKPSINDYRKSYLLFKRGKNYIMNKKLEDVEEGIYFIYEEDEKLIIDLKQKN